jgi:hypothetical protein
MVSAALLALVLLALAGYYTWRQVQLLRSLRAPHIYSPLERSFLHRQAWRRLVGSGLMLLFAVMLIGLYFVEGQLSLLPERPAKSKLTPEQVESIHLFSYYALALAVLFFAILFLAVFDLLATRRYTLRQLREMQEDHQAMLEEQGARLRGRRNGAG